MDYIAFVTAALTFLTTAMQGQSPEQQEGLCDWFIQLHDKAVTLPPMNKVGIPIRPLIEAARARIQAAAREATQTPGSSVAPPPPQLVQATAAPASIAAASTTGA